MNILIVHAHHEPQSFSSALCNQATSTLSSLGHSVTVSDLYRLGFDPVSDRRNFSSQADPNYLKQAAEESFAWKGGGFAPELEAEIAKLENCDLLVFNFPLWWFGMPAILKGWVDKAFPAGRIYGGAKLYEGGLGQLKKRAMVIMTTGGGPKVYGGYGVNPSLEAILAPIEHGVFAFNGFLPLEAFVAWSPAHISQTERANDLERLDLRLRTLDQEKPRVMPKLADFPSFGLDTKHRYMVIVTRIKAIDQQFKARVADEQAAVAELRRLGVLVDFQMAPPKAENWKAFMHFRASSSDEVSQHLSQLPLAPYLHFEIIDLAAG